MTTTQPPRRVRRPMVEMTGTVSDLREGDYVDELGGNGFRHVRVGALVHRVSERPEQSLSTRIVEDLRDLRILTGDTTWTDVPFTNPPAVVVEFLAMGRFEFKPQAPAKFRRFTD